MGCDQTQFHFHHSQYLLFNSPQRVISFSKNLWRVMCQKKSRITMTYRIFHVSSKSNNSNFQELSWKSLHYKMHLREMTQEKLIRKKKDHSKMNEGPFLISMLTCLEKIYQGLATGFPIIYLLNRETLKIMDQEFH